MVEHGEHPPWDGYSRYGFWFGGERLWDGTRRWVWRPPDSREMSPLDPDASPFQTMFQHMWQATAAKRSELYATKVSWLEEFRPRRSPIRLPWWKRLLWRAE